jgi:DNA-directed RNA polymerase subunit RPC12/RpoP
LNVYIKENPKYPMEQASLSQGDVGTMAKQMMMDLWQEVLISISRLCNQRHFTGPTIENVIADLHHRYGRKYSRRSIEEAISLLESQGLVYRRRGILQDGRITLLTTKEAERVALTLIKLSEKEALVHNGWEGIVYDPKPSDGISQTIHDKHLTIISLSGIFVSMLLLFWWASRLPKPIAKWTCVNCGCQLASKQFNEKVCCPHCGQQYFVTLDRVWLFPFSSPPQSAPHEITFKSN